MKTFVDVDPQEITSDMNEVIDALTPLEKATAVVSSSVQTLTAADILSGVISRSGGAGLTDTTDTAANIIAAMANPVVGDGFEFTIQNNNSGTLTLAAGTGVTLVGTTTIATVNARRYLLEVTGATTVSIVGLMTGAV